MAPLDPGQNWLAAGITGIPRQREWDAVATADAPGAAGDEVQFVALPDGRLHFEGGSATADLSKLAGALEGALDRPYRAVAVRRDELWAVGACSIRVLELSGDFRGDRFEIVRTAEGISVRVDGIPSEAQLPELEELGAVRAKTFVVRAHRLVDRLFEIEVEPL